MVGKNRRALNWVLEGVQPLESVRVWCRFWFFPRFWFSEPPAPDVMPNDKERWDKFCNWTCSVSYSV